MKVSGFSFIRNALKYDYPIVEAISSILPVCDEFVVAVGKSEDNTLELISNIDPKVRIIETEWDDNLREGGQVLAEETDKAFTEIAEDSDWAFYIQGDEVLHEQYLPKVRAAMQHWLNEPKVDGLLFDYLHFYGSFRYVGASSNWYAKEVRVVRNRPDLHSFQDAQGFRKANNALLTVAPSNACMYHYGWVKDPRAMQKKQEDFNKLWHDDEWVEQNVIKAERFNYAENMSYLKMFEGTHPKVMEERIKRMDWEFDKDISFNRPSAKDLAKKFLQTAFGWDVNYKNYKLFKA